MSLHTYVSKSVEIEAMQWEPGPSEIDGSTSHRAKEIVAWVIANGGEARYEPANLQPGVSTGSYDPDMVTAMPARIMVRTKNGWQPCAPGWWVVKGSETFVYDREGWAGGTRCLDHYPVRDLSEVRVSMVWEKKSND